MFAVPVLFEANDRNCDLGQPTVKALQLSDASVH